MSRKSANASKQTMRLLIMEFHKIAQKKFQTFFAGHKSKVFLIERVWRVVFIRLMIAFVCSIAD